MTQSARPNRTALFAISWIGLFIFNLLFARLTTTVPVSIIALFLLFSSTGLYKERPEMRPLAIFTLITAITFIAITYIGTIWIRYEVPNLLDIRAPFPYVFAFYLVGFINAASFTTVGMALFKAVNSNRSAFILLAITAAIYFAFAAGFYDLIAFLSELANDLPAPEVPLENP